MSNYIKPIDPLVQENNDFFHADEKMHYILENKTIEVYLEYIKNKHKLNEEIKPVIKQVIKPVIKPVIRNLSNEQLCYSKKRKIEMLEHIWSNIVNLENTIRKFKI